MSKWSSSLQPLLCSYGRLLITIPLICFAAAAAAGGQPPGIGLLYWVGGDQLARSTPQGADFEVLVSDLEAPDGLTLDLLGNRVYWSNMGSGSGRNSGSIQRSKLDGSPVEGDGAYLVEPGSFQTGKEIELDRESNKLYWADRDGKRIMRSNADGTERESVLHKFTDEQGQQIELKNPVGIALDHDKRHVYITDRFLGSILRFGMELPAGDKGEIRSDVEVLVQARSPEDRPIDIDLDLGNGLMYWTDRGVHQVLRASLDGSNMEVLVDQDKVAIQDPIGMSLDLAQRHMYWTDMTTHMVHRAAVDGSGIAAIIGGEGILNGVPYGPLGIQYRALEPTEGSAAGGDTVAVLGSNFVPGETFVQLGDGEKVRASVQDRNLLTFTAPKGKPGLANLKVSTPRGEANLHKAYRYRD